ncbi:MAG: Nif3-like dinuclear metal center hexameric protein [Firmicutes bacterium]|nr:Nif3-like dinuclear metal center hexameric protein [Bacillota bacterium]
MGITIRDILKVLQEAAPLTYAESYDNPGFLVGLKDHPCRRIMLAVDASFEVIAQAKEANIDMLIVHHPLIFHALKKVSDEDLIGRRVYELARAGIALYALHTNLDAVPGGNIDLAARRLGLKKIKAVSSGEGPAVLRIGTLEEPLSIEALSHLVMERFDLPYVRYVDAASRMGGAAWRKDASAETDAPVSEAGTDFSEHAHQHGVNQIALCTGSGMDFAELSIQNKAQCLITGDIGYHRADEASLRGLSLIEASHFGTDRLSLEPLKEMLEKEIGQEFLEVPEIFIAKEKELFNIVSR